MFRKAKKPTNRREFLRSAGIISAAAAVPIALVTSGCEVVADSGSIFAVNSGWQEMADKLKSDGVYSTANEGIWAGRSGSHAPQGQRVEGGVIATTMHAQSPEDTPGHFITSQFVEGDDGTVFDFILYTRLDSDNVSSTLFVPPSYTGVVKVYSHCTEHDLWQTTV